MACRWRAEIVSNIGEDQRSLAVVVPVAPEGVALFIAITSLPSAAILLAPDPRMWSVAPPLPAGTTVIVPSSLAGVAAAVSQLGCVPHVLSEQPHASARRDARPLTLLQSPGIVLFTSGSTGLPKPVFRSMNALLAGVMARLDALGLESSDGIVAGVSLAYGHGVTRLLSAMVLGGPLALLEPLDYRVAIATLAMPDFKCWSATAHFADVLGRCAMTEPAVVPRICLISSPIARSVFDAFRDRFGVPLRQNYSSTETGIIAVDAAPAADVRGDTVGRPLAGIEIRIGTHPDEPLPAGEIGRIWVRSPWLMNGYGFPPDVEPLDVAGGWWPTQDRGTLTDDGRIALAGRIDDCIRTREGRLVNLAFVSKSLLSADGVRDVAVEGLAGPSFGAVLECETSVTIPELKDRLSDTLPQWAWPRTMAIVDTLPRLPSGKTDRVTCSALLQRRV
jgi:acyl-coenzyme A synthetase/AMP-(fatty) acid ligase